MTYQVNKSQAATKFVALQLSPCMQQEQCLSCVDECAHKGYMSAYSFLTVGATQPFWPCCRPCGQQGGLLSTEAGQKILRLSPVALP